MLHIKGNEKISFRKLYNFLSAVDKVHNIPLAGNLSLTDYTQKLLDNATICYFEDEGELIAVLAGYTENTINNSAFISIVDVLPDYNNKIAFEKLVEEFIGRAKMKRLNSVEIYENPKNEYLISLFKNLGFNEWFIENDIRPNDIHLTYHIQQKTALVTAIGSFSADIVIKNLKKNAFKVIGCDIYSRELLVDSYNVSSFYQVPKVINEDDYLRAIDYICESENITHILPSTDVEVDFFNNYRDYFEKKNIIVCISPSKTLAVCRNKKLQSEFIEENVGCIKSIPTKYISECDDIPFDFPMVAKPYDGRSSQGVRYIYSKEDWLAAKTCEDVEKYIVQPKIKGNVVTVDVVRSFDGNKVIAIPRLELLRTQNGAGISVKVFPDSTLEENCKILADKFGIVGCVNFEFLLDDEGNYHYIECNPRFSGGVEFSCLAGYDCVSNHVRSFEKDGIDDFIFSHEIFIARKYEEYVTRII